MNNDDLHNALSGEMYDSWKSGWCDGIESTAQSLRGVLNDESFRESATSVEFLKGFEMAVAVVEKQVKREQGKKPEITVKENKK